MLKKNNFFKILLLIAIFFCFLFSFFQKPTNSIGLDNLAYVTAIGIDVGSSNTYKINFQVSTIQSSSSSQEESSGESSSSSSSGEGGNSSSFNVNTVECNSIDSGISLINTYMDKSIDLSHCGVIVISEELAKKGISPIIYSMFNKIEIRPDCNIIVSRIPKDEFSDDKKPTLEKLLPDYYDATTNTENLSGYTANMTISNFFYILQCHCNEPFAPLATVRNSQKSTAADSNNVSNTDKSPQSVTSTNDKPVIEILGLAVFKDDVLVGTLSETETICYLILSNQLENATISFPSPLDNSNIDLNINLRSKPKIKVTISNSSPYVDVKVKIDAKILSLNNNTNDLTPELINTVENSATQYITNGLYNYLNKTSKEYNSDITAFGKYANRNFTTIQDWHKYNWLANYYTCTFNVDTEVAIKSGYLLTNE